MQTSQDLSKLPAVVRYYRAFAALARVLRDPTRTDEVLTFYSNMNAGSDLKRLERFFGTPAGARLYAERRAIDSRLDLDALAALPADTLGYAYAHFLRDRGLTPDVFDGPPPGVTDERASYLIQRMRQTHDLWHVVTGYDTDEASEIALQAFTYGQVRAPAALILVAAATARGVRTRRSLPREAYSGFRDGARAEQFATFPWEDHWATPLADVRRLLNVTPVARAAAAAVAPAAVRAAA